MLDELWMLSQFIVVNQLTFALGLRDKHQKELDNLTVTTQPLKTCKFFILAILQWLQQQTGHVSMKKFLFALISILAVGCGIMITAFCKPDEEVLTKKYQFVIYYLKSNC